MYSQTHFFLWGRSNQASAQMSLQLLSYMLRRLQLPDDLDTPKPPGDEDEAPQAPLEQANSLALDGDLDKPTKADLHLVASPDFVKQLCVAHSLLLASDGVHPALLDILQFLSWHSAAAGNAAVTGLLAAVEATQASARMVYKQSVLDLVVHPLQRHAGERVQTLLLGPVQVRECLQ